MQWYLDNAEKKAMTILCSIEATNLIFKCCAMLIILNIIHQMGSHVSEFVTVLNFLS